MIYNAARVGRSLKGCPLIVTALFPCVDCARGIIQSGFSVVVAPKIVDNERWLESNRLARLMMEEVGVEIHEY